jgi:hypothetical protein
VFYAVLGQSLYNIHQTAQYSDEDFFQHQFNGYRFGHFTNTEYKIFLENNKDNTYLDMTGYSYSKCFSVGTFVPDAPGSKRERLVHPGR